jgi:hypothetical protein
MSIRTSGSCVADLATHSVMQPPPRIGSRRLQISSQQCNPVELPAAALAGSSISRALRLSERMRPSSLRATARP